MIPEKTLRLLEFDKLLQIIAGYARSEATASFFNTLQPLSSRDAIIARSELIAELRTISSEGDPLRIYPFLDIGTSIQMVRPEGAVLEPKELAGFLSVLRAADTISLQITGKKNLAHLPETVFPLSGQSELLGVLERSIDSEGNILDEASFRLAEIRQEIRKKEGKIRRRLDEIVRDNRVAIFLQDDFITLRSGRWVIPVRMDSKGMVPGVVHDVSKSGETAFVEPLSIIHESNELENLYAEQKTEERRILRSICSSIRTSLHDIVELFRVLVYLDAMDSIARFADRIGMSAPNVNEEGQLGLSAAHHPLLMVAFEHEGAGRIVVPLDVQLGGKETVMVITGSNAGGKTVAIKTIGLLQIMAMTGMPVPADSSSSFPVIDSLLIDIGDAQSIESSLSTFSAHVSNIAEIMEHARKDVLVLIDELGTGTDPDEGAALACAVLDEIRKRGSLVFATSHLTGIKSFVHRTDGMLNASMDFDYDTSMPLYRLRVGEPGPSNALETAKRYGMPQSVVQAARQLMGNMKIELDAMIADMNSRRKEYEGMIERVREERQEIERMRQEIEEIRAGAEEKAKQRLAIAYKDAREIILAVKKEMRGYLDAIKIRGKEEGKKIMREAGRLQEEVTEKINELLPDEGDAPDIDELVTGTEVYVRSLAVNATVSEVNRRQRRVKVRTGNREIEVPVSEIRESAVREKDHGANFGFEGSQEAVSLSINLVGLRVDEALSRLEPYLNHASLAGISRVTVIHGIGKGLLAKAVRDHLQDHPLVKSFGPGEITEGGAGVTVVRLS